MNVDADATRFFSGPFSQAPQLVPEMAYDLSAMRTALTSPSPAHAPLSHRPVTSANLNWAADFASHQPLITSNANSTARGGISSLGDVANANAHVQRTGGTFPLGTLSSIRKLYILTSCFARKYAVEPCLFSAGHGTSV